MFNKIAIIAPASGAANYESLVGIAIDKVTQKGFEVHIPQDLINPDYKYESNSVDYRVKSFLDGVQDSEAVAIWGLRGGYGSANVAQKLMEMPPLTEKKTMVGFSDLTAMALALNQKHGWYFVHGPVFWQLTEDNKVNPKDFDLVFAIMNKKIAALSLTNLTPLNEVEVPREGLHGKLAGGNLTILTTSVGTSWQLDCKDKILFIEDVNEPGYKVARALGHLTHAKVLEGVKAIVCGAFYNANTPASDKAIIDFALSSFAEQMQEKSCPVYKTEAFGHFYNNQPMVIGADAEILVSKEAQVNLNYHWDA